jgi:phosphatidyl-myo-inositol alpha-mannosyltransferase
MKKLYNFINSIKDHLKCFLIQPRNYLYLLTYPTRKKVALEKCDPNVINISNNLKEMMINAGLNLKINFIGSSQLEIAGQRDIDILIECSTIDFEKYIPVLEKLFGPYKKKKRHFIEWFFNTEGYEVELVLIDPNSSKFREQMASFNILSRNKIILREYEKLKNSANGLSIREYQKRKILFFHRIISLYGSSQNKTDRKQIIFSNYDDIKNPFYSGGGARSIHEVAKRLAKDFEIRVITGKYPGSIDEKVDGVIYKRIGTTFFGPRIGQIIFSLLLSLRVFSAEYDVWIENLTPPFGPSLLPLISSRPVIALVHMLPGKDMWRKYRIPFLWFERIGLKFYQNFIVLTEEIKEIVKKHNKKALLTVIPNGVNLPDVIEKFDSKHILFLGRIEVNQKGLDLLIGAYGKIAKKTSYRLVIAGEGSPREVRKLKLLIANSGCSDKIDLVGKKEGEKKADLFKGAIAAIIPSRFETFSLVALEAFSSGVPIITFDLKNLNWIPETCAIKVPAFNEESLAVSIEKIILDEGAREEMASNAREFAKKFSWDSIALSYADYINSIIEKDEVRKVSEIYYSK